MSESAFDAGAIGWVDLTIGNAEEIRDFYQEVVGWRPEPLDMGGYSDFVMSTGSGKAVAGVCHARGSNAELPAQWLIYLSVEDLDRSIARCMERGGRVVSGPRSMGSYGRCCAIQDPAGAVAALIQPPARP